MSAWLRTSDGVVILAAVGLLGAAAATDPISAAPAFIAFALLIAVAELFEVTLPNEMTYSLGLAPALGFTLLGDAGAEVVLAFGLGAAIAVATRAVAGRQLRLFQVGSHAITLALATALYEIVRFVDPVEPFRAPPTEISPLGLVVVFVTILVTQSMLHAGKAAERQRIPFLPVLQSQASSTAALHLSVVSVGALLALAYPKLGFYAFALFLAPLAATHFAFRQFSEIRKTYLQTIRALSKVPEMAGYTRHGHSTRVAELAVAIGRELGITEREVTEIEYAALLHDIGRVSIPDPDEPHSIQPAELATVGATIVRQTGHFPMVATMIERQQDHYRRRGEDADPTLPMGAKIINVASAFDDLTHAGPLGLSEWDAMERLRQGMAFDHDPMVIQALTRVLEKRDRI